MEFMKNKVMENFYWPESIVYYNHRMDIHVFIIIIGWTSMLSL